MLKKRTESQETMRQCSQRQRSHSKYLLLISSLKVLQRYSASFLFLWVASAAPALGQSEVGGSSESSPSAVSPQDKEIEKQPDIEPQPIPSKSLPKPSFSHIIKSIEVRGNAQVESDAVKNILVSEVGKPLREKDVKNDLMQLHDLGYFSDIRIKKRQEKGGVVLIVQLVEKPAIIKIEFEGNEEIAREDFDDKLNTKLYTIVNESLINQDVRLIEQQYAEKGFFLANITYKLVDISPKEVELHFIVDEGTKVQIAEVDILGNKYFTDEELIDKGFATRPYTRGEALSSSSLYSKEFVDRDGQFLDFIYRDNGFAEVKVSNPILEIDTNRDFVKVTMSVEEGLQYNMGTISVSGDMLFEEKELLEALKLKPGNLFRQSHLIADVEYLQDKYGDKGYAYADANPKITFDRENRLASINFIMTKGEKVYFNQILIVGNSKTRDNVVRREVEVADSELYSGTGLRESKKNINRLGFFEEVQILKERVEEQSDLIDLRIKVKERPTGQLQAAVGFTPSTGNNQNSWFGRGSYKEENQSGKGWQTNLSGQWNGEETYSLELGFYEPRIDDGPWSFGFSAFLENRVRRILEGINVEEREVGGRITVGRDIIELIRGSIAYSIKKTTQNSDVFFLQRFKDEGITSSMIFGLRRNDTDNYLEPTDGSDVLLRQTIAGGPGLGGDFAFYESTFDANYYYPIDFSETYRTYFRIHVNLAHIYPNPAVGDPVPFVERYRLGGYNDLRGYDIQSVSPEYKIQQSPGGTLKDFPKGGDKKLYFQFEYYLPLIQQARIKSLIFTDMGRVYDDDESLELKDFKRDVGFGFRWITPIAPFRFEWAYPLEKGGRLGDMKVIFYIGY